MSALVRPCPGAVDRRMLPRGREPEPLNFPPSLPRLRPLNAPGGRPALAMGPFVRLTPVASPVCPGRRPALLPSMVSHAAVQLCARCRRTRRVGRPAGVACRLARTRWRRLHERMQPRPTMMPTLPKRMLPRLSALLRRLHRRRVHSLMGCFCVARERPRACGANQTTGFPLCRACMPLPPGFTQGIQPLRRKWPNFSQAATRCSSAAR